MIIEAKILFGYSSVVCSGLHQTTHMICQNDPWTKPSVMTTFPDPYHEQHWQECPKHLQIHHLDPHGLHQTSHMICQNDPCTKPSVNMTFPDLYHEQYWHEFPDHIFKPASGSTI